MKSEYSPTQRAITKASDEGHEVCICAAIFFDGRIWPGMRHGDCIEAMRRERGWTMTGEQMSKSHIFNLQGFLTNRNRYVTREEALKMHQALGIPSAATQQREDYRNEIMFSEDLY
jgi:hypothetical protein